MLSLDRDTTMLIVAHSGHYAALGCTCKRLADIIFTPDSLLFLLGMCKTTCGSASIPSHILDAGKLVRICMGKPLSSDFWVAVMLTCDINTGPMVRKWTEKRVTEVSATKYLDWFTVSLYITDPDLIAKYAAHLHWDILTQRADISMSTMMAACAALTKSSLPHDDHRREFWTYVSRRRDIPLSQLVEYAEYFDWDVLSNYIDIDYLPWLCSWTNYDSLVTRGDITGAERRTLKKLYKQYLCSAVIPLDRVTGKEQVLEWGIISRRADLDNAFLVKHRELIRWGYVFLHRMRLLDLGATARDTRELTARVTDYARLFCQPHTRVHVWE